MLKSLEEKLAEAQRLDTKAQSALDLKRQNLKDETRKRKDLLKNKDEVRAGVDPTFHWGLVLITHGFK